jgi:hypothetical protein
MPQRVAAILSILAFAMCLLIGGLEADNPFTTTVSRALVAMLGTFVVGLILGSMAQKMLKENVSATEKSKELQANPKPDGR